ncbi:MAG: nicotinate-nucleotide--dimethylbenzimidazole phosphoribosyltransferase [Candidatus Omnitrophota bacterium]|nr:nicotinate-nucleotide--dimethylbenzimidazole phosphoribosyltransferase [Candidatus Omnitrophota bacterium]
MQLLNKTIKGIKKTDKLFNEKAQARLDNLTKPQGSLGRLEDLAKQVAVITGKEAPALKNKVIFTFAADHGIAESGVSAYPQAVTAQMVANFINGGAAINVLARHVGARVVIVDLGVASDLKAQAKLIIKKVGFGTKNMANGPAMKREEAVQAIENGIEIFEHEFRKGIDIAGIGDMGIGNTASSSAITAVITGLAVEDVTGRGTGIDDRSFASKIEVIKKAIALNKPDKGDALDILSKVGGFEIGGLAGVILAASSKRIPVVIDGFISGAAALVAYTLVPETKDYMIASHCSVEKGHKAILHYLGLSPILDLHLRLGEGTGSALGISLVEASIKILTEMATFSSAAVSERVAG